jgi:hypothetical protein
MMTDPYETIGVDKDATQQEIKKEFRKKSAKMHPDKGGDEEEYQELTRAYMILKNPKRRQHWDATGSDRTPGGETNEISKTAAEIFMQAIHQCDLEHDDLIDLCKDQVKRKIKVGSEQNIKFGKEIAKKEKALKRLKRKKKEGTNVLEAVILHSIEGDKMAIAKNNEVAELLTKVIQHFDEYEYEASKMPPNRRNNFFGGAGYEVFLNGSTY